MKLWSYKDESNPSIPSKYIRWKLHIPLLLIVSGTLGWENSGSHSVSVPLLGIHYARHLFTNSGWKMRVSFGEWGLQVEICFGKYEKSHSVSFFIGVSKSRYINWQLTRSIKKMSPEKKQQLKNILEDILKESK